MIRAGESVFVDSGAWIALALQRDPLHARAVETWDALEAVGAKLATSVPVIIETFTFLERNASREAALAWKDGLRDVRRLKTLECPNAALEASWTYFARRDLHRLSSVDDPARSAGLPRRATSLTAPGLHPGVHIDSAPL